MHTNKTDWQRIVALVSFVLMLLAVAPGTGAATRTTTAATSTPVTGSTDGSESGTVSAAAQVQTNANNKHRTPTATSTRIATSTATPTNTAPPTATSSRIATSTATPPSTSTATPVPTAIPTTTPIATPTSTPTTTPTATNTSVPPTPGGSHAIKTVFLILMENHNWSSIQGNIIEAPYINNTLLPMASHAEQYHFPTGMHPSLPNYLWLEAGTNFGITDDNPPISHTQTTPTHLVTLLSAAGISWKAYEESISGTRCPLTSSYPYRVHHDPFVYFADVTNNLSVTSTTCLAHVRPYTEMETDLNNKTVARYNFITPNVCDDMHDPCAPISDTVKQGDTWLSTEVPKILTSQAYQQGGALFITWDEGAGGSDGPIGMIVLSPYAKGNGYSNTIAYTHGSTLRTLEEIFGVSPWLGEAANVTDLRDLFSTFP